MKRSSKAGKAINRSARKSKVGAEASTRGPAWAYEPRTTIAVEGGVAELPSGTDVRRNDINPPKPFPMKVGLRFTVTEEHLGKLECLARSRFEIGELKKGMDLSKWETSGGEISPEIAQSVNASSAIEDEGVAAEELPLILAAATNANSSYADDELQKRRAAIKSIYEAQVWALTNPYREWLSPEFILELHYRMFNTTKRKDAGKLKSERVHIFGGGYSIVTLPVQKTEEFLRKLCERTNRKMEVAQKHAEGSMFLTAAEFVLDFLAIHPFQDGNGRTARILSTYLLERCGYHFARFYDLDSIILEKREEYYSALYGSQMKWYLPTEDLTPWIDFYIRAVFNQWERAYRRVREESLRNKNKR